MTDYFYVDTNGQQQGPVTSEQLKELVAKGIIKPDTHLNTGGTRLVFAEHIPGLFSDESKASTPVFLDIGFTRFITGTLVPILWILALVFLFLDYGYSFLTTFGIIEPILALEVVLFTPIRFFVSILGIGYPVVAFIANTVILFLSLVLVRIILEGIIVLFRIETHLRTIRDKYENK